MSKTPVEILDAMLKRVDAMHGPWASLRYEAKVGQMVQELPPADREILKGLRAEDINVAPHQCVWRGAPRLNKDTIRVFTHV